MTWPTWSYFAGLRSSLLVSDSAGPSFAFTVFGAGGALASVLVAPPVSPKEPASRSAWVMVWLPVQTIEAPGARLATGRVTVLVPTLQLKFASAGVSLTDT